MFRYFTFLGIKTLTPDEVDLFDLDYDFTYKALLFEWLDYSILLFAVGKPKDSNAD